MPYRNPDPARMAAQKERAFEFAGQSAIWRRWVSATSGVPGAGIAAQDHYAERPIWALFGKLEQVERETPAGMIAAATVQMTTHQQIGRADQLIWRGVTYEVDSDPMPARIGAGYITIITRVST